MNRMTKWYLINFHCVSLMFILAFCQKTSASFRPFRVRTKFPVFILSKKYHAFEDMNRMTKCAEWRSFIWLIFIALALCLFCSFCQKFSANFSGFRAKTTLNSQFSTLLRLQRKNNLFLFLPSCAIFLPNPNITFVKPNRQPEYP